jgi:hypothetical protein
MIGIIVSADEFDNDIQFRIIDQVLGVISESGLGIRNAGSGFLQIPDQNGFDMQIHTKSLGDPVFIVFQYMDQTAAYSPETGQS